MSSISKLAISITSFINFIKSGFSTISLAYTYTISPFLDVIFLGIQANNFEHWFGYEVKYQWFVSLQNSGVI